MGGTYSNTRERGQHSQRIGQEAYNYTRAIAALPVPRPSGYSKLAVQVAFNELARSVYQLHMVHGSLAVAAAKARQLQHRLQIALMEAGREQGKEQ
ncbi:hypothetical protein IAQ61_004951 [Plenodomus lingam]|nr:hypothetical protein IAQ61_004951 [Plenodomus lingam]